MNSSNLRPAEGVVHSNDFRRGRGHGSGNGKTAGKRRKGQKMRSGAPRPGSEGGQMPLHGHLPRRGFKNRNMKDIVAVNIERLGKLKSESEVTAGSLIALGVISHTHDGVKVLGNGELTKELTVKVNVVSEGAKTKIKAVGGTCEVL